MRSQQRKCSHSQFTFFCTVIDATTKIIIIDHYFLQCPFDNADAPAFSSPLALVPSLLRPRRDALQVPTCRDAVKVLAPIDGVHALSQLQSGCDHSHSHSHFGSGRSTGGIVPLHSHVSRSSKFSRPIAPKCLSTAPQSAGARKTAAGDLSIVQSKMLGGTYLDKAQVGQILLAAGAPSQVVSDMSNLVSYTPMPVPVHVPWQQEPATPEASLAGHESEGLYNADWHRISTPSPSVDGTGGADGSGDPILLEAMLEVVGSRVGALEAKLNALAAASLSLPEPEPGPEAVGNRAQPVVVPRRPGHPGPGQHFVQADFGMLSNAVKDAMRLE